MKNKMKYCLSCSFLNENIIIIGDLSAVLLGICSLYDLIASKKTN